MIITFSPSLLFMTFFLHRSFLSRQKIVGICISKKKPEKIYQINFEKARKNSYTKFKQSYLKYLKKNSEKKSTI
jgi:hypothetical protein